MLRGAIFDEMSGTDGKVRAQYKAVDRWLKSLDPDTLARKRGEADVLFKRLGITFRAYGTDAEVETTIPFDLVPRVIGAGEWEHLSRGLVQRAKALNAFLHDAYHGREICRAGKIPEARVVENEQFVALAQGLDLPRGVHAHICGIDVVRVNENEFYVLEDNARTPSGVSYMLENREVMMRLFPGLFATAKVRPVETYTDLLLRTLREASFSGDGDPTVVVLTPGPYNSAYFEHLFLADEMGVELVQGNDLFVDENRVFMRTPRGPQRVDVIYRRIDDPFLDPLAFNPASMLGVPGLAGALRARRVNVVNAIGNGIADDKSIYPYVPEMIRFYLGEEPLLANVPTYDCSDPSQLKYVLERLPELVVKEVHGSGGKGMLVGPTSTKAEVEEFRAILKSNADGYIAQPTLSLSTVPTFVDKGVAPRHVDLRPFVLSGKSVNVVPGGLTRVALKEGSLVVNSSQGGGTKDTWVLDA